MLKFFRWPLNVVYLRSVDNVLQGLSYYYIPTVQRLAVLVLIKISLLMYLKALHITRMKLLYWKHSFFLFE